MNKLLITTALIAATVATGTMKANAWSTTCTVSAAQYQKIETGMSYSKVVGILGCEGDEMSDSGTGSSKVVSYMWSGNGGVISNLVVLINQGKVMAKSKSGLN
jgi:hypothetical protein